MANQMGDTEYICACRWHMRFTRWVRYMECQWGQLAEFQMDTVALQRWILMGGNSQKACEGTRRVNNTRLLKQIDDRWEVDRAEKADTQKKPLSGYEEWAAIDMGLWGEVRVRNAIGDQEKEEDMSRWESWELLGTPEQWKWLTELGCYPWREPVRASTEELGIPQIGEGGPFQEPR